MKTTLILTLLAATALLAACEREQTIHSGRRGDDKAWQPNRDSEFVAAGWKPGDEASWAQQIRDRARGQNEYNRAPAQR